MKLVEGTSLEFMCDKTETVTIDITEKNTNFLVSFAPHTADITMTAKAIKIHMNNSGKTVTVSYDFNGNGGSYTQVLSGSKGGSFTRRVLQPTNGLPATRTYVFHV